MALLVSGCASGSTLADGLLAPQGAQQCTPVSEGLFPIDAATVVERDPIEAWLIEWAASAEDGGAEGIHAVFSVSMARPDPDEDDGPEPDGDEAAADAAHETDEGAEPPRPGVPDAFLMETTLQAAEVAPLTEVVRRARLLDHGEGAVPSRIRLEVVRNSSGQLRITPMVSTNCHPAAEDPRRLAIELERAARGARSTGSAVAANLWVDGDGRVGDVQFVDVTPGFEGGMALTETLTQTRFHPAHIDGHPRAVWVRLPVSLTPRGR